MMCAGAAVAAGAAAAAAACACSATRRIPNPLVPSARGLLNGTSLLKCRSRSGACMYPWPASNTSPHWTPSEVPHALCTVAAHACVGSHSIMSWQLTGRVERWQEFWERRRGRSLHPSHSNNAAVLRGVVQSCSGRPAVDTPEKPQRLNYRVVGQNMMGCPCEFGHACVNTRSH